MNACAKSCLKLLLAHLDVYAWFTAALHRPWLALWHLGESKDLMRFALCSTRVLVALHHLCLDKRTQHTPKRSYTLTHILASYAKPASAPNVGLIQAGAAARPAVRRHSQPKKSCTPEVLSECALPTNANLYHGSKRVIRTCQNIRVEH
jgi:hypothetical protein